MKKLWIATALMASLLYTGAGAEEPPQTAPAPAPAASALSQTKAAGEDALDTVLAQDNHSFLETLKLPAHYTYKTLPLPVEAGAKNLAGLLTVEKKNVSVPILAVGWDRKGEKADAAFGGMFVPGGHTQEAGQKMLDFNVALVNGANIVNDILLLSFASVNAAAPAADRLPYDFMTLDMGKVEQLHKVKSMDNTYTFSAHPAFVVDSWVVPLYTRGFLTHLNGTYRFLLLTSLDSSWKLTDEAAEDILRAYGPEKK